MADWHQPLDYMLHTLTNPQLDLLSWARVERIKADRQWQMQIASLPLQEKPQDFYDEVMGFLGDDEGDNSGSSGGSRGAPYLHELDAFTISALGLPVRFVDVPAEDSGGST